MPCVCPEGRVRRPLADGRRRGFGDVREVSGHDCAYVAARNKLIPQAARMADAVEMDEHTLAWDVAFLTSMTMLAKEHLGVSA